MGKLGNEVGFEAEEGAGRVWVLGVGLVEKHSFSWDWKAGWWLMVSTKMVKMS